MSTTVKATPARGREVDVDSFSDLTDLPVSDVSWADGQVAVTFDGSLSPDIQVAVQQRILSTSAADEAVRLRAAAYLTKPSLGSLDEAHEHLRRLTRLVLGVDSKTLPGSNPTQDRTR